MYSPHFVYLFQLGTYYRYHVTAYICLNKVFFKFFFIKTYKQAKFLKPKAPKLTSWEYFLNQLRNWSLFSVNPNEAFNNSLLNTYKSNHDTVAFFHPPFIIMYRKLHAFACRLVYNVSKSQCLQGEEQNALNTS